MRTLLFLLKKEFLQISRDKGILILIFAAPIIQLIFLPLAANYEIKNVNISVVDHDQSSYSTKLISKILASGYFQLTDSPTSYSLAFQQLESDHSDLILEIPAGFERNLVRENEQILHISANAINGTKATIGSAYLKAIINDFNNDIRLDWIQMPAFNPFPMMDVTVINRFNPQMNYYSFMVPGILALLVTIVGSNLSSLNIVKEKEMGTIEQINVTPIRKYQFILGKLIPFWIIGNVVFTIGLFLVGWMIYGIVPVGSILLLYAYLAVYLIALLGLGLLISTYSETQQQAMSINFFFLMTFILLSGLFTPIESMPYWAQLISKSNPVTYLVEVVRMIVLKGSTFSDITTHFVMIIIFAVIFNVWAILNYKKTN